MCAIRQLEHPTQPPVPEFPLKTEFVPIFNSFCALAASSSPHGRFPLLPHHSHLRLTVCPDIGLSLLIEAAHMLTSDAALEPQETTIQLCVYPSIAGNITLGNRRRFVSAQLPLYP